MQLYCGDAVETMSSLGLNKEIDLVLCDPPYGTTRCKWDSVIPFVDMWRELDSLCKDNAAIVFTASQPFSSALIMSNPGLFRHEWIWIKNRGSNFANTVREPMKEHEHVLVFSKGKWVYNKQMQPRNGSGSDRIKYNVAYRTSTECYNDFEGRETNRLGDLRVPTSYQKFDIPCGKDKYHPTQKPLGLMEYLVKTYSNKGDTVLDFAMGSGTTGVACKNLGREFIGIDNTQHWVDVAKERIDNVS